MWLRRTAEKLKQASHGDMRGWRVTATLHSCLVVGTEHLFDASREKIHRDVPFHLIFGR